MFQVHSLCQNNPCRNKAECKVLNGEEEFVCDCPLGYQGATCEDRIDVQVQKLAHDRTKMPLLMIVSGSSLYR